MSRTSAMPTALNDLFKAPMGGFVITPELAQLLK